MKLAFIIYGNAIDPDVAEVLENLGLQSYTKWSEVIGKGKTSGPRLGSHVWPGINSMMMLAIGDEHVAPLADALKVLKERFSHEGLKLYVLPVDQAL
ncbi:MAG: transcriptional regulator [Candidatus Abyssobacteria bacterium SURF_5]|uniref:Transcriptional regulator n=1 Tax=Abyssobacteria bacterium (strain SURF_5) TaxID=2093360 RepID=A0A3A4NB37_ABYX5|nr:MAG: transcriptional regulator [Candidatus Abyssubacteria bacterium SURF_5]